MDPAKKRGTKMYSKLTLSVAVALVLSAAGGVARANPIPTSTDEARAQFGQITRQEQIDHTAQADAQVTSTDEARAEAGNKEPAPISRSVEALIANDLGEGRGAAYAGDQNASEQQSVAANPAGSGLVDQGN
jgi:hypothetical protein